VRHRTADAARILVEQVGPDIGKETSVAQADITMQP
jgi:hypothetical protein